jgi:AcrR family transcriptional regulator
MAEDEEPWLPLRAYRAGTNPREQRQREREQKIHEHARGRARRREVGLTQEEIVATAMAVADAEGVEAVSMRRIGRELGAGAMSLYWHVASKEELQDLMLEAIEREIEVPEPSGDWRADLRNYARNTRAAMLRHQWALDFLGARPPTGPADARNADRLFGALDGLGLDMETIVWITMTVATYVMGAVMREIQEIRSEREMCQMTESMTEQEISAFMTEFAERIRATGRYPRLERLIQERIDPDNPKTREQRFDFGMDVMLDGIAARLPLLPLVWCGSACS